jgi:hypothetical protein
VRLFTGMAGASGSSLCEDSAGEPLPLREGAASVELPACGVVTLAATPAAWGGADAFDSADAAGLALAGAAPPGRGGPVAADPGRVSLPEPAQPVYARYWLHGKGPAPAGNMPVAVHLSPGRLALRYQGAGSLRLTVGCGPQAAAGAVRLEIPAALSVEPGGPLAYDLPGLGYAQWDLTVRARPDAPRGRFFVTAQITDGLGQLIEDAVLVTIGAAAEQADRTPADRTPADRTPADRTPADRTPAELAAAQEADQQALAAEVDLTLAAGELALRPGQTGEIAVRLRNRTASPIRGEAQLVSPFGSWDQARPWTLGFSAGAGAGSTLRFTVAVPADARPGQHWWVIVKVMYFGRLRYSEPVAVTVGT